VQHVKHAEEVLINTDTSWNGICSLPGLPDCAPPVPKEIPATKEEEAEIMISYAWSAGWLSKGTVALVMWLGTDEAFEFSIMFDLPALTKKPTMDSLWENMATASVEDRIVLPSFQHILRRSISRKTARTSSMCMEHSCMVYQEWVSRGVENTSAGDYSVNTRDTLPTRVPQALRFPPRSRLG
jgi:hypothetical protein